MILVTGATGHIGNVLIRQLVAGGESVRAFVHPSEDLAPLAGLPVEVCPGDVLDPTSLAWAMRGVDVVYHLAGLISISDRADDRVQRVNVTGTENVVGAALAAGVRRLVYTSSIHAIQRAPAGVVIDESLPFDPDNPAGDYDRAKARATLAVLAAVRDGLDAVIVCPTGVIGPYDYRRSEMGMLIFDWMKRGLHFLVDGLFDFVDVRDVAAGLILACRGGRTGEAYILAGEHIHLRSLHALVAENTGLRAPGIQVPMPLARIAARFAPLVSRITRRKPRFTAYSLETVTSNSVISHAKAARQLGYSPRSLRETVADTVAWWRAHRQPVRA